MTNYELIDIKTSFFRILMYVVIGLGVVLTAIDLFVEFDNFVAFATDIGIFSIALLSLFILNFKKNLELAATLFLNIMILLIGVPALEYDALHNPYFAIGMLSVGFIASILLHKGYLLATHAFAVGWLIYMTVFHTLYAETVRHVDADGPLSIGLVYTIIYGVISTISYHVNRQYESTKDKLYQLSRDLQEKNEEVAAQNEELRQSQEALSELNNHLEEIVSSRTEKIREQNKQFAKYSFDNAHKVRGPLARMKGLFNLYRVDKSLSPDELIEKACHEANAMDEVVHKISRELDQHLDDEDLLT